MNLILIAIGGALGALARYFFTQTANNFAKIAGNYSAFPLGTFGVNVLGSMLAGLLYYLAIRNLDEFNPLLKNFLLVGFLGGFTTFSAFCLDFFRLATAGHLLQALFYVLISVVLSILALFFGFYAAKLAFS